MKWNLSLVAALSLTLSACGGGRAYADYGVETAAGQGSVGAQGWGGGAERPRRAAPAPQMVQPAYQDSGRAGASYAAPGTYQQSAPQEQRYRAPDPQPQDAYADPAAGATGPSGSSRQGAEQRYDEVGYAGIRGVAGGGSADGAVVAVHRSLPAGSVVEVTALDSGKTILVLITGPMGPGADHPIDLSAGAARQLGYPGTQAIPVRVRKVNPTAADQAALNQGRPAQERPDTPPVLLNALRKHLPTASYAAAPVETYTRPSVPVRTVTTPRTPSGRGYFVQVAALSSAANAQSLAQSMGGFVKPGGGLYRVQIGPFATQGQAEAARQRAAGAGYGDARVFAN